MRFVKFIAFIISICCEVVPAMAVDYITVLENQIYSEDIDEKLVELTKFYLEALQ